MLTEKFDAYGEVLPQAARGKREGQAVFWLLVITIVSARIIYHPGAPAFEVGTATDVKQAVAR